MLNSGRLAYKAQYLKGLTADINSRNNKLSGEIICNEAQVASLKFKENRLQLFSKDNYIGAGYSYNNDGDLLNHGQLILRTKLARNEKGLNLGVDVAPTSIFVNSKEWSLLPSSVSITGKDIVVNSFGLVSGEEAITINGRSSETQNDTLTLSLQRFDISIFNSAIPALGIKGALSGTADLTSSTEKKGLLVSMMCDSTYIADTPLGILDIGGIWDSGDNSLDLTIRNDVDGRKTLDAAGKIFMEERSAWTDSRWDMSSLCLQISSAKWTVM